MKIEFNLPTLVFAMLFVLTANPNYLPGQVKDWDGSANDNWTIPNNWVQAAAPIDTDVVRIGNMEVAHGDQVNLNTTTTIRELQISNGAGLAILTDSLTVTEDTHVSNVEGESSNPGLRVGSGRFLTTRDLGVSNGGRISMENGTMFVNREMGISAGAGLVGRGLIDINEPGSVAFRNDGFILADGGALRINEFEIGIADGIVDLDGFTENGQVNINPGSSFHVNDAELEPFSGTISMAGDALLSMQLPAGWIVDGQLNMFGTGDGSVGQISGGPFTLEGSLNAIPSIFGDGDQLIQSETIVTDSASVFVAEDNGLEFNGTTTIDGGNFQLGFQGSLVFTGMTNVHGGTFQTFSDQVVGGVVRFDGMTFYHGNVVIDGVARQGNPGAVVTGLSTITADVFDMDGTGSTAWEIGHVLTVNAGMLDNTGSRFDGSIEIVNPFSRLTVNLEQEDDAWEMAGDLHLQNGNPGPATRLAGSPVELTGQTYVLNGSVRVTADTTFGSAGETDFQNSDDSLLLTGQTNVQMGAMFTGDGTLINDDAGRFNLNHGASLGNVALVNRGQLEVADSAGIADVAEFDNTDGNWLVEIGGYTSGSEFDVLQVGNGAATLGGTLSVKLIDVGSGQFIPSIGDEFTILSAVGGIIGQFENTPVSIADGNGYQWEVIYNSNDVVVRLDSIIPDVYLGDVNEDGAVDLLDVAPFVELLTTGGYQLQADMNCDGVVDLLDVELFVELLTSS